MLSKQLCTHHALVLYIHQQYQQVFVHNNEELHSKLSKADSLDMLDAYKVEEYDSGKYVLYISNINSNVKTMHSTCIYIAPMHVPCR